MRESVINDADCYPFGMRMAGRYGSEDGAYRYGYNGKENDDEIKGEGNSIDYGFRMYDPRVGRFLSVDPLTKTYPWYTPYQFGGNNPARFIDLDGLEEFDYMRKLYETATSAAIEYVTDKTVAAATNAVNNLISYWQNEVEISAKLQFEAKYTIGGRVAFELKNGVGADLDAGSVRLFGVKGSYDLESGEFDGEVTYYGKDGKKITSQGVSASIPLHELGIPASVSGEAKSEKVKNMTTGEIEKTTNTLAGSIGQIVGAKLEQTTEHDHIENTENTSTGSSVEAGVKLGAIGVVEANVKLEIKVE